MNFKETMFTQVLYNLIHILQGALAQWRELKPEDLNLAKATRMTELNPVARFEVGPFESSEEDFFLSDPYVRTFDFTSKRIREKITDLGTQPERRAENAPTTKRRKAGEEGRRSKNKPRKKAQVDGIQGKPAKFADHARALGIHRKEIEGMKKQIKELQRLSSLLGNVKANLEEFVSSLSTETFEKILKSLEKSQSRARAEEGRAKNKMMNENKEEGRLKEMNNISYNNQYQIDAIFIINRLSEERENFDSKFNEYKGTDVEILKELTGGKMKELFEKKLNNLNADSISKATEGDFPKVTHPPLLGNEMDLVKQLRENFTETFGHQNVTPEQIHQMSKIVDFVERYRGIVSNLGDATDWMSPNYPEDWTKEEEYRVEGGAPETLRSRTDRKVLSDVLFDFLEEGDSSEGEGVRRKGGVT